ncbi:ADP-ribose pyrophosphatase [Grosmannia clavigera kw1407]|uniref:ADP-ribose pyrophosphatase n=1 Tax=Grosmannia clavigera (strain kw1407 / UAMH 11150) TaxID=655863 RepID=F0X870_GROCL|nr:ADP-ribose pyrophosphatase [Grosmannia clavigera kw1407]EFX05685.1 ADP-ribose pyrophosphatase [Grosmannia clavigera kw1407]
MVSKIPDGLADAHAMQDQPHKNTSPESTHANRLTIMNLPPEIHIQITRQLIYPDALSLKHTCRYFYTFVDTGIKLKVDWFLSRRRLHLDCPNETRCDLGSDLRFCRGSVPLLMKRRREHIECESRPGLGCLIYGTATCTHRRRPGFFQRWFRKRLTVEMCTSAPSLSVFSAFSVFSIFPVSSEPSSSRRTFSATMSSFAPSPKTQEPVITRVTDLSTADARWIALKRIEYVDQVGKARTWEVATRKTRGSAGVDAVAMGNVLRHPSRPPATLVVIQYRPPLDAYTVEWPAGLVDATETAEQAAVREFKEETGYDCRVVSVSPPQAADPGMTNANMQLVMVDVDLPADHDGRAPDQRLEDGEHIERVTIPLADFYDRLVEYAARDRFVVAAKLFHFAAGMRFAQTTKLT